MRSLILNYSARVSLIHIYSGMFILIMFLTLIACNKLTSKQLAQIEQHKIIATQYMIDRKYQNALDEYNSAIDIDGVNHELYFGRSKAFIGLKAYRQSIKDLEEVNKNNGYNNFIFIRH